jgi:hypothetical protein
MEGKEYRDSLAEKLKEIRNSDPENTEKAHTKAEGYLDATQETTEYKLAKYEKLLEDISSDFKENAAKWFVECAKDGERAKDVLIAIEELSRTGAILSHWWYWRGETTAKAFIEKRYSATEYSVDDVIEKIAKDKKTLDYIGYAGIIDGDKVKEAFESSHSQAIEDIHNLGKELLERGALEKRGGGLVREDPFNYMYYNYYIEDEIIPTVLAPLRNQSCLESDLDPTTLAELMEKFDKYMQGFKK